MVNNENEKENAHSVRPNHKLHFQLSSCTHECSPCLSARTKFHVRYARYRIDRVVAA